jgi:hypothetical protein
MEGPFRGGLERAVLQYRRNFCTGILPFVPALAAALFRGLALNKKVLVTRLPRQANWNEKKKKKRGFRV